MPSMLAADTDCGSFTGYDALVTVSESGGTSGSSERTVTVTPYAQVPLTETGIPQLNEAECRRFLSPSPVAEKYWKGSVESRYAWCRSPAVWGCRRLPSHYS